MVFFLFKQKSAYEMRISDWSSDVCSSDLENENARIVIRAEADSWIEVRAPGGEILLTRVLRAGDVYRVPDRAGLTLITGNAGGLAIAVAGKPVPRPGQVGAVRPNVAPRVQARRSGARDGRAPMGERGGKTG